MNILVVGHRLPTRYTDFLDLKRKARKFENGGQCFWIRPKC